MLRVNNRGGQRLALFEYETMVPIIDFLADRLFACRGQLDQLGKPVLLILPNAAMRIDVLRDPRGVQSCLERHFSRGVDIVVDEIDGRRHDGGRDRNGESDRADQFSKRNRVHHSAPRKVFRGAQRLHPRRRVQESTKRRASGRRWRE